MDRDIKYGFSAVFIFIISFIIFVFYVFSSDGIVEKEALDCDSFKPIEQRTTSISYNKKSLEITILVPSQCFGFSDTEVACMFGDIINNKFNNLKINNRITEVYIRLKKDVKGDYSYPDNYIVQDANQICLIILTRQHNTNQFLKKIITQQSNKIQDSIICDLFSFPDRISISEIKRMKSHNNLYINNPEKIDFLLDNDSLIVSHIDFLVTEAKYYHALGKYHPEYKKYTTSKDSIY